MADLTTNFRSSMHGFNRDDVIAFIESTSLENEKELRALRDANARLIQQLDETNADALQAALDETRAALSAAEERYISLEAEKKVLEGELAAAKEALAAANAPAPTETPARVDISPLNAPIAPICENVPAEPPKDYAAMELAAYRRAETAERLARERAGKVYEQLSEVFSSASERLDSNEADLSQLTQALQFNMKQMQDVLDSIRGSYTDARESFRSFSDRNREIASEE